MIYGLNVLFLHYFKLLWNIQADHRSIPMIFPAADLNFFPRQLVHIWPAHVFPFKKTGFDQKRKVISPIVCKVYECGLV